MSEVSANNKRIAKNALFLYFRMFLVMGVSLFTVRIILNALGEVDYGIYQVVAGITLLFSFLSNTMAHASQRFFSFELGKKDYDRLSKIFRVNITIYALLSLVVLILAQTVGLWFLNNKMQIPTERMHAANWVFQFAILSFVFTMLTTPYRAVFLAREKMSFFAYLGIFEVLGKLLVAYLVLLLTHDKLITFAILDASIVVIVFFIYMFHGNKRFEECRFSFCWNKAYFKEILSYTGWSFYGHASMSLRSQGVNIILNLFFGPVVNTSRGIAVQVNNAITSFYMNFYVATKPQIIKYYAQNNLPEMHKLIFSSSRICYFLMLFLAVPLLFETPYLLTLWLKNVPEYAILFTRLTILATMVDSISPGLITSADATGRIKKYQLLIGTIILLNIPFSWIVLKMGYPPQAAFYVIFSMSIVTLFTRIYMARIMVSLSVKNFFTNVLLRVCIVTVVSFIIPIVISTHVHPGLPRLALTLMGTFVGCGFSIFFLGLTKNEKGQLTGIIKKKLKRSKA